MREGRIGCFYAKARDGYTKITKCKVVIKITKMRTKCQINNMIVIKKSWIFGTKNGKIVDIAGWFVIE